MSDPFIDAVCSTLKAACRHFVLPGERRENGEVRVVFVFWNPEEERIERGAGARWVRQQWEKNLEPTVLLGFETESDVRNSAEGSLLGLDGIVYVELPVRAEVIQAAIDGVRSDAPGGLDLASRARNAADFTMKLRGWRHTLIGGAAGVILARQGDLAPEQSPETRREKYDALANLPADIIERHVNSSCLGDMPLIAAEVGAGERFAAIKRTLDDGARIWHEVEEILAGGFAADRADRVHDLLDNLEAVFGAINAQVEDVLARIGEAAGHANDESPVHRRPSRPLD